MDAGSLAIMVPIAAIVMGGLIKIMQLYSQGRRPAAEDGALAQRVTNIEQELGTVRQELSETQERLDFAERLLAQSREGKKLE